MSIIYQFHSTTRSVNISKVQKMMGTHGQMVIIVSIHCTVVQQKNYTYAQKTCCLNV